MVCAMFGISVLHHKNLSASPFGKHYRYEPAWQDIVLKLAAQPVYGSRAHSMVGFMFWRARYRCNTCRIYSVIVQS